MSLFSKLFGGSGAPKTPEPEEYEGFRIIVDPVKEGGGYRLAALIEKEIGGEVKRHRLIRADTFQSQDEARQFSLAKAKQMIDEQGEGLLG
jgi:hypothetical protein